MNIEKIVESYIKSKMSDPNFVGEMLRDYVFVGDGLGCYSNFEMRPEFITIDDIRAAELLSYRDEWSFGEDADELTPTSFTDGNLVVSWLWDGDGTLYFRYGNTELWNTDCKKIDEWEWINE